MFPTLRRTPSQTRYAERLQHELDDLAHRTSALRAEAYRLADEREMIYRSLHRLAGADELVRCEEVDRGELRAEAERILALLGAVQVSVTVARDAAQAEAYAAIMARLAELEASVDTASASATDPPLEALAAAVNSASPDATGATDDRLQAIVLSCASDDQKEVLRRLRALAARARAVADDNAAMSAGDRAAKAAAYRAAAEAAAAAAAAAAETAAAAAAKAAASTATPVDTAAAAAPAAEVPASPATAAPGDAMDVEVPVYAPATPPRASPARRVIPVRSPTSAAAAAAAPAPPAGAGAVPVSARRGAAPPPASTAAAAAPPAVPQGAHRSRAAAPARATPSAPAMDPFYSALFGDVGGAPRGAFSDLDGGLYGMPAAAPPPPPPPAVDAYGRPLRGYYTAPRSSYRRAAPSYGYGGGGYPFGGFF